MQRVRYTGTQVAYVDTGSVGLTRVEPGGEISLPDDYYPQPELFEAAVKAPRAKKEN